MFRFFIIYLIFNVLTSVPVISQTFNPPNDLTSVVDLEIQEAFKFSNVVTSAIEDYIQEALPPEAKAEGDKILEHVREGLENCESFVQTPLDIWQYKICSSSLLRDGMAALGALQAKYRPLTSGATRKALFW
ncbi:uncharacterized protein ACRADG_006835 [Cochliomyia hominivorax]